MEVVRTDPTTWRAVVSESPIIRSPTTRDRSRDGGLLELGMIDCSTPLLLEEGIA